MLIETARRLCFAALAIMLFAAPASAADLFMSEYIEGSSFNKAIEVFNPGSATVDLFAESYTLEVYFNGNTAPGTVIALSGTVAAGDVFVYADSRANSSILAVADQTGTSSLFNGDDAVVLKKNGVIVDAIGEIGVDPGSQWGSGVTSTQDNTLRRQVALCSGDLDADDSFDPSTEWDGYAQNDSADLGSHGASCSGGACSDTLFISEIIEGSSFNKAVELVNLTGATVDLGVDSYTLEIYFNGNTSAGSTITLSGTVGDGDVFVYADSRANGSILAAADQTGTSTLFNGDDAVVLTKNGVIVDVVGEIGFDPGSQWGSGLTSTQNNTLRRNSDVCGGDDNGNDVFDPSIEWTGYAQNDSADLGSHTTTCTCGGGGECPADLIVSEVVEGSSNNKAVELYNATGASVDLGAGNYQLQFYFNGNTSAGRTINLSGTVADGDTFVVAHSSAFSGTLAVADQTEGGSWYNGDDAIVLVKDGTDIDVVGEVGFDPGSQWGSGVTSTQNNTIRRNDDVCDGDPSGNDAFDPSIEWTGYAQNDVSDLGSHTSTCTCDGGGGPPVGTNLEIWEVQGSGLASPFLNQTVTLEDNIVTAVGPEGFFIQTPTARDDADVDTSNGLYVYTITAPTVTVGDQVDVTGNVAEFFDFTELNGTLTITVDSSGNPLPPVVTFNALVPSPNPATPSCAIEFECYEGMRVQIAGGSVGGPNQAFGSDPIAEVHITAAARAYRETGVAFPGLGGTIPTWDGNPEVFELDPDKLGLTNQTIAAGSTFDATGVIGYEFGGYELWPTTLSVTTTPTLPLAVPVRAAGEFTIGSLNLFRLYDDIDDPGGDTVVSTAEYQDRLEKFSRYIRLVLDSPDVLGVQEVEKISVLSALASRIQSDDATIVYTAYLVEGNDVGGIDVGYLVRNTVSVTAVTQQGAAEIHTFDGSLLHDRPQLLLEASYTGNGAPLAFAVMNNHTRSLSRIDDPVDGARVRNKRLEQAQSIAQKVQTYQTTNPST
ncbi:MAG: lamin tail domain-containing protein, partial [Acidobacteriota bacterium]